LKPGDHALLSFQLEKENKTIPIEDPNSRHPVLYHDLFTNGIVYLDLGFDLHTLPIELLPLTEIFARALTEMGTDKEDYVKLSQRIGKSTGGIYGNAVSTTVRGSKRTSASCSCAESHQVNPLNC
jgi:Zn-dependent M16 (insulinase) family peptidase